MTLADVPIVLMFEQNGGTRVVCEGHPSGRIFACHPQEYHGNLVLTDEVVQAWLDLFGCEFFFGLQQALK